MSGENDSERLSDLIERQNELLRLLVGPVAQAVAKDRLETSDQRKVFACTDGSRSSRQIASETGVSKSTVSRWWQEWHRAGLIVEPASGNPRAVLTLDELMLPAVPAVELQPQRKKRTKG